MNKQMRLRAAAACLLPVCLLCSCGVQTASGTVAETYVAKVHDKAFVDTYGEGFRAEIGQAEQAKLESMTLQLKNQYAELYLGAPYYDVAVRDLRTGSVWFSNPGLVGEPEGILENEIFSQLMLEYYDSTGKRTEYTSYPDAVDGDDLDQVEVSAAADSLTLTYTFGKRQQDLILCRAMSETAFEKLIRDGEALAEQDVLVYSDIGVVERSFGRMALEEIPENERSAALEQYPGLKDGPLYVMSSDTTEVENAKIEKVFLALGWTAETVKEEFEKVASSGGSTSSFANFVVPLTYRLQGADLLVSVDTTKISETDTFMLHKVSVLPGFGAAPTGADGYLFLPDGTGILVDNDRGSDAQKVLSLPFYGSDFGLDLSSRSMLKGQVLFPVFGIKQGGAALLAVTESGEANAGVEARVSDSLIRFNRAFGYFEYRAKDTVMLDEKSHGTELIRFSSLGFQGEYRMRYHFLYGDNADYSGMATYYRQYLLATGGLRQSPDAASSLPINIRLLGSVEKKKTVAGLPVTVKQPLTTFAQAEEAAEKLSRTGGGAGLTLTGWMNGGEKYYLNSTANCQSELGGREGLESLRDKAARAGVLLYPQFDFATVFSNNSKGKYKDSRDTAYFLNKNLAAIAPYDPASNKRGNQMKGFIITPSSYQWITESFLNSYRALGIDTVSVGSVGYMLGSDFNSKRIVNRQGSRNKTAEALQMIEKAGISMQVEGGNAYVLPYASRLTGVPVGTSAYKIQNRKVPFLGMVLHGIVPYTCTSLNDSRDLQQDILNCLENGAGLHFDLIGAPNSVLKGTELEGSPVYPLGKLDELLAVYEELNSVLKETAGLRIMAHETVAPEVSVLTYEDGSRLYINRANEAFASGAVQVDALGYKRIKVEGGA